jgi:GT2 family glycosyltransferase
MGKTPKYDLSVIIVNYNVTYFLEQCLNAVEKGIQRLSVQVFVVDNNSIDNSVAMVQEKFPAIQLIVNKENVGFSKANNQAIEKSDARYVLLLNPDTVIEEDTLVKVVGFMDQHPEGGGLGVRMIDGKGRFLPESKRGLPRPSVAFYKIFGISQLFPKSKRFAQYHAGHIGEFETSEVDVLSGAFMLLRAETLHKTGLLDETFFMYGEDIDLSYRITLTGYKNYYYPDTQIIHYKGESTKKSSVNYVFVFYRAMIIFAQKHFSQQHAQLFSFLINGAIYFRASLSIGARFFKQLLLPALDGVFIFTGLYFLTHRWQANDIHFPESAFYLSLPAYSIIWMLSTLFSGGYDRPIRLWNYLKGVLLGTLLILVAYALLPKVLQFSRLYILLGAAWVATYLILSRLFLHFSVGNKFDLKVRKLKKFAIVGSFSEFERVKKILELTNEPIRQIDWVDTKQDRSPHAIGNVHQLDQVVHIHRIDEVIFCAKDTRAQSIIYWMCHIGSSSINFKIAQPESQFLIGSNSIETAGDLYVVDLNAIQKPFNRRNKRTLDIALSLFGIVTMPIILLFFEQKKQLARNFGSVLFGKKSFVGYSYREQKTFGLPPIKSGILTPEDLLPRGDWKWMDKLNIIYARDYSVYRDLQIIIKGWHNLDRIA